jgi:hypothetical protein
MTKHGKNAVFNIKGRILKGTTNWAGYKMVNIRHIDGKFYPRMVHRLVAKAFVSGYDEGLQVNHIDENKQNNRYDNLEWVTSKQNNNHGSATLRATYNYNNLLLYGNIEKDFGTIDAFSVDAGIQYAF